MTGARVARGLSGRVRARGRQLAVALSDGFRLGVLDEDALRRADQDFYATATEAVDGRAVAYTDPAHVRSGLSDWETSALARLPEGARVVVTSAGAGREVHGLGLLGHDAVGYEPHELLLAAGRRVLEDPDRLRPCDYDRFPPYDGTADAVVIGWGAYMLVRGSGARVALLRGAHDVLEPGGLLLVSYFDRPDRRYFRVVATVGSGIRRLRGRPPLELGDALSPNFVHYFTPSEVTAELDRAGFEVLVTSRTPYGHAVARRR